MTRVPRGEIHVAGTLPSARRTNWIESILRISFNILRLASGKKSIPLRPSRGCGGAGWSGANEPPGGVNWHAPSGAGRGFHSSPGGDSHPEGDSHLEGDFHSEETYSF